MVAMVGCADAPATNDTPPADTGTDNTPADTTPDDTGSDTSEPATGGLIELRLLTAQIGENAEAEWLAKTVSDFNARYEGQIRVNIDGVAGDAVEQKLRTDAASDTMPDIFVLNADSARFNLIADSGRATDLMPFMEADSALWNRIDRESAAAYTDANGQLLGLPYAKAFVGIFYNHELFSDAGIAFPTTWDAFMSACEALKDSGVAPLALQTADNAWTSMLLMSSMLGTTDAGKAWLSTPAEDKDFTAQVFVDAVAKMQVMLAEYTTLDAVGANYAVAANNFLNGQAAMIANGPWMIGDFSNPDNALPGFENMVSYAIAPGNGIIQMENIAYAIGSKTDENREAAFKFLQFLAEDEVYAGFLNASGNSPCFTLDISLLELDSISEPFIPQAMNAQFKYDHFAANVKPAVGDALAQLFPDLASGAMTPEDFAAEMQEISDRN